MKLIALLALCAACTLADSPDIGTTSGEVDVTWMNAVGVTAAGNDLTKTGATGWNAGAASVESLPADGYVEFTTGESTTSKMAGLSVGDAGQQYADIDFAVWLKGTGVVAVYEAGVLRSGNLGNYAAGDVFRIEATNGVVTYAKNGVIFYTSATLAGSPLGVDTSLNTPGATIQNVQLVSTSLSWQNLVGATAVGNDLAKTDGQSAWTAGASSVETLGGNGFAELRVGENDTAKMVGLGNGDASQHYADIEYAIWLKANGNYGVYESGILRNANLGAYVAGDVFRLTVANGVVSYSKNGASPFYTSAVTPSFPLRIDTSLYTPGATVNDARLVPLGPLCEGSFQISDAAGADLLAACTIITGTLTINAPGLAVSLPRLERVGALVVTSAASIDLPALESVTGPRTVSTDGFYLSHQASLPSLTSVIGNVVIAASLDAPALTSIDGNTQINASVNVPSLSFVRGRLNLQASFSAPALAEVQGDIDLFQDIQSLQLPALVSAYSFTAGIKRTYLFDLDLSSLAFLGGGDGPQNGIFAMASPKNLTSLSLPSLQSIEGGFIINSRTPRSVLQTVTAPVLESTGGSFTISNLVDLSSLDFPSLTSVGPNLTIQFNLALPNCYATDLRDQLFANGWSGTVNISGNDPGGSCP